MPKGLLRARRFVSAPVSSRGFRDSSGEGGGGIGAAGRPHLQRSSGASKLPPFSPEPSDAQPVESASPFTQLEGFTPPQDGPPMGADHWELRDPEPKSVLSSPHRNFGIVEASTEAASTRATLASASASSFILE